MNFLSCKIAVTFRKQRNGNYCGEMFRKNVQGLDVMSDVTVTSREEVYKFLEQEGLQVVDEHENIVTHEDVIFAGRDR
jgi:hypothetical protein